MYGTLFELASRVLRDWKGWEDRLLMRTGYGWRTDRDGGAANPFATVSANGAFGMGKVPSRPHAEVCCPFLLSHYASTH